MAKQNGSLLFFEFSLLPISRSLHGVKASVGYQLSFLVIGDLLLGRLPDGVAARLKSPISADVMAMVAAGNSNGVAPERARAAIMVAETLLAICEILQPKLVGSDKRKKRFYPIEVDKNNGNLLLKEKVVATANQIVSLVSKRTAENARIKYLVVLVMWKVFLGILREGRISVPGLRKKISK
ncbi:MAG: hypothetical protein A2563_01280 [Candidatus Magasanikbacteria bacterium RIFOXYD1_FULL_40_23]|uniref:Uncharacterized protein n=1 Tax=Candidatus Magasanikbacteria bacterium RIFOXYD1_FULL_40_23 TaxID=1798705 RepID=A0A1F6PAL7_9BACT|nr:MAG: hypothetical protein A2563_01280 [Candidatus Magasanikbacteria bacterium RIFOXYD1_FULL_40_23]